jgi:poly-beta-1,6-N-acetyl-D-glucosamine synthase
MTRRYLAITPARDEERYLPALVASMVAQTVKPERWIVIDDGSTDRTAEIIDAAARANPWIEPHHLPQGRQRLPGGESLIMQFLPHSLWQNYDAILRLDADLSFGPLVAEMLLGEMERNPRLGIASPVLCERPRGRWQQVPAPSFHTPGPVKMYSRACFEAIGGLEPGLGWDTIDEVRALMQGFETRQFPHIVALHHRVQGGARSVWRNRINQGRAAYNAGYSLLFLAARAGWHSIEWPPFNGVALLLGYLESYFRGLERAASPDLVAFVRRHQVRRLLLRRSLWQ